MYVYVEGLGLIDGMGLAVFLGVVGHSEWFVHRLCVPHLVIQTYGSGSRAKEGQQREQQEQQEEGRRTSARRSD